MITVKDKTVNQKQREDGYENKKDSNGFKKTFREEWGR